MKKVIVMLLLVLLAGSVSPVLASQIQTIDKDELKAMLGASELVLFDVRRGRDWSSSEFKITGAVRLPADQVEPATQNIAKDKKLVFYCA